MNDIAVVCAHNPGKRNTGMYSVDLAAAAYFSSRRVSFDLVKFVGHPRVGDLTYKKVSGIEGLRDYGTIAFWGDFQQNPIWGRNNFAPRHAREQRGLSAAEAERAWRRDCLLEGYEPPPGQRVYSVGTCYLGALDWLPTSLPLCRYRSLLERFTAILPRDVGSVELLKTELKLLNVLEDGWDCAALSNRLEPPEPADPPLFSFSFGRTIRQPSEWRPIVARVEAMTGLKGVPLTWLRSKYSRYGLIGMGSHYENCMKQVRQSRLVLTDIYHLSVNAVASGVPVVCLGSKTSAFRDTCDDNKKQILFSMLGMANSYCVIETGAGDRDAIGAAVTRTLATPARLVLKSSLEVLKRSRARVDELFQAGRT